MTILKEGKDQKELLQLLEQMNDMTAIDSLVKNEEHVWIECIRENGRLKNWKMTSNASASKRNRVYATGRTYRRFFKELETLNVEAKLFRRAGCSILCYLSTEAARDYQGRCISHWVEIEPGCPYTIEDGCPHFQTKELALVEADHQLMIQTGLAFYDDIEGIYYPLTQAAYVSLGRLFDCAMAFRNLDQHLLGSALLLAEKISCAKELRIIHRRKGRQIRPVLSTVGKTYSFFPQYMFFETALAEAAPGLGVYNVEKWSIADEFTELMLTYSNLWEDYFYRVTIKTGDSASCSFSVTLSVQIGHAEITLLSNSKSHKQEFRKEDVVDLFCGFHDMISKFDQMYDRFTDHICHFKPDWLDNIHKTLGQKRCKNLDQLEAGNYHAQSLLHEILQTRYMEIPARQMAELKSQFLVLINKMDQNLIKQEAYA